MALVTCPDCGKEISDQAPACPNCGRPAAPQPVVASPPPATEAKKKTGCGTVAVVLILGTIILVAFSVVMTSIFTGGSSTGGASSSSYQRTGDERRLRNGTSAPSVPIFDSEEALNEVRAAKTDRSIAALIMGGSAFLVDQGTRVLITDGGSETSKIRVLEGPMVGRTGFVPSNWCRE